MTADLGEALTRDNKEFGKVSLDEFRANQKAKAEGSGGKAESPRQPSASANAPASKASRPTNLARALAKTYERIGAMLLIVDQPCGMAIINNADDMAASLDELAKTNPKVRKALESMIATSAWGNVIMAHVPVIMAISMHHSEWARDRMNIVGEHLVSAENDND